MAAPPGGNYENAAIVWLIFAAIVGLILFIVAKIADSKKGTKKAEKKPEPVKVGDDRGGVRRRAPRPARNRMMAGRRDQESDEEEQNLGEEDEGVPSLPWDDDMSSGKIGAKKTKKLEMKAEKKAQREAMEAEREDRKHRQNMIDAQRKKDDEELKKEEELKEEEEKKQKEEEARKEYEEYLILKQSFVVEGDGTGEADIMEESQSLLQEFIDYIKSAKVVLLEDLAAHFGLRTQDAINRITALQDLERLTGVIDDRGKFIYISPEELEAVAKFIKQRGRINISELAESSNQLINLQADKPQIESQPIVVS